mmetsp:Transcript_61027/g.108614  ORF Transcript_61027/g.108614 Transcript_61027/m.108614 type:complete len:571 (-) Transcript_61027:206-1918(-)
MLYALSCLSVQSCSVQKVAFLLTCLACISKGRNVQHQASQLSFMPWQATGDNVEERGLREGKHVMLHQWNSFARLLLAGRPAVAFNPLIIGQQCQTRTQRSHLLRHAPEMKERIPKVDAIKINAMNVKLQLSRLENGAEHPSTLELLDGFASTLSDLGCHSEAEPLKRELLKLRRQVLGEEHPDTIAALGSYAETLVKVGRKADAMQMQKDALELTRRVLGSESPHMLMTALITYANAVNETGRQSEAQELKLEAFEVARVSLKDDLHDLESVNEVETEIVDKLRRKILGSTLPDMITAVKSYAFTLDESGRKAETAPLIKEALELTRRIFGPRLYVCGSKRKDTLKALRSYADTLTELGCVAESELLYKEVLELTRLTSGSQHPDTFRALNNYAVVLVRFGRKAEAEDFLEEMVELTHSLRGLWLMSGVLEFRQQVLGLEHPLTLLALEGRAEEFTELGRVGDAEQLMREVLDVRRRILGPGHVDSIKSLSRYVFILRRLALKSGFEEPDIRLRDLQEQASDLVALSQESSDLLQGHEAMAEHLYTEARQLERDMLNSENQLSRTGFDK